MFVALRKRIGFFNLKRGFKRLGRAVERLDPALGAKELIDFVFSKQAELMTPWQVKKEISELIQEAAKLKPKFVLEIGTANGGTLFLLTRVADPKGTIISIDLPGGKFGGGYPDWKIPFYRKFARPGQSLHLLRENSHADATFEKVKALLGENKLDYLFIDGDHTYDGVKHDFHLYSPLVRKGGMVGFHDINYEADPNNKVYVFWREIRNQYTSKEFIADPSIVNDSSKSIGIGLIFI